MFDFWKCFAIGVHFVGYVLIVLGFSLYDFRLALGAVGTIIVFEFNKK